MFEIWSLLIECRIDLFNLSKFATESVNGVSCLRFKPLIQTDIRSQTHVLLACTLSLGVCERERDYDVNKSDSLYIQNGIIEIDKLRFAVFSGRSKYIVK